MKAHRTKNNDRPTSLFQVTSSNDFDPDYSYGINKLEKIPEENEIVNLYEVSQDHDKYLISVLLNGKRQQFEVDSGAKFSLLSENEFTIG